MLKKMPTLNRRFIAFLKMVTEVRIPPSPPFLIPYFPILTCANNAQEMLVVPFTALIVTNRVFSLSTGVTVLCLSMIKNIM